MGTQFPSRETWELSLALVAAANANQMDWMVNQWWEEAVQVFDFSNKNWAAFAGAVNAVDESQYKPLWNYCNPDGDAALTTAELTDCGQRTGEWMGMQEDHQRFLYKFAEKYWSVVDQNKDGALNYDEFRFTHACFAIAWKHGDQNGNLADGPRHEIALFT